MEISIKKEVLAYLYQQPSYVFGGVIDDYIHKETGAKTSNVSRRCRELFEAGLIDRQLVQVDGKGPFVVKYRLHKDEPPTLL